MLKYWLYFLLISLLVLKGASFLAYDVQCKTQTNGANYLGHVNFTLSNRICQPWSSSQPHSHSFGTENFPDHDSSQIRNYCRNPDPKSKPNGPWCYTLDPLKEWEYCDVPMCNNKQMADICETEESPGYRLGDIITITSPGYPQKNSNVRENGCQMKLTACQNCRFDVLIEADLPHCKFNDNDDVLKTCHKWCQSLRVADSMYEDLTSKAFSRSKYSIKTIFEEKFSTVTNEVTLQYCNYHKPYESQQEPASFKIKLYVVEKYKFIVADKGDIESPMFPNKYWAGTGIYKYFVMAKTSTLKSAQVIFDDWQLSANGRSQIDITTSNLTWKFESKSPRPAVAIPASHFYMQFDSGTYLEEKLGFHAHFVFDNGNGDWMKHLSRCGSKGDLSLGDGYGGFQTNLRDPKIYPNEYHYLDCIWTIPKPGDMQKLMFKLLNVSHVGSDVGPCKSTHKGEYYVGDVSVTEDNVKCLPWKDVTHSYEDRQFTDGSIEKAGNKCRNPGGAKKGPWCFTDISLKWGFCNIIRDSMLITLKSGLTSAGNVIPTPQNQPFVQSTSADGMKFHVEAKCVLGWNISMVFYSYDEPTTGATCEANTYYCKSQGKCLTQPLKNKFAEYCGQLVNPQMCLGYVCRDHSGCYSDKEKCDGVKHCDDGSDEYMCSTESDDNKESSVNAAAIIVPVVLLILLLIIGGIVGIYIYYKRKEPSDEEKKAQESNLVEKDVRRNQFAYDNEGLTSIQEEEFHDEVKSSIGVMDHSAGARPDILAGTSRRGSLNSERSSSYRSSEPYDSTYDRNPVYQPPPTRPINGKKGD